MIIKLKERYYSAVCFVCYKVESLLDPIGIQPRWIRKVWVDASLKLQKWSNTSIYK